MTTDREGGRSPPLRSGSGQQASPSAADAAPQSAVPNAASAFDQWIDSLDEDVIQGEYGYEAGEFTVYPDHWRPMWEEGLTPQQAFRRALDAFAAARAEEDRLRAANWQRIQAEDARYLASAAGARSDETAQQAQPEGRQSGGEAATPNERADQ